MRNGREVWVDGIHCAEQVIAEIIVRKSLASEETEPVPWMKSHPDEFLIWSDGPENALHRAKAAADRWQSDVKRLEGLLRGGQLPSDPSRARELIEADIAYHRHKANQLIPTMYSVDVEDVHRSIAQVRHRVIEMRIEELEDMLHSSLR